MVWEDGISQNRSLLWLVVHHLHKHRHSFPLDQALLSNQAYAPATVRGDLTATRGLRHPMKSRSTDLDEQERRYVKKKKGNYIPRLYSSHDPYSCCGNDEAWNHDDDLQQWWQCPWNKTGMGRSWDSSGVMCPRCNESKWGRIPRDGSRLLNSRFSSGNRMKAPTQPIADYITRTVSRCGRPAWIKPWALPSDIRRHDLVWVWVRTMAVRAMPMTMDAPLLRGTESVKKESDSFPSGFSAMAFNIILLNAMADNSHWKAAGLLTGCLR